MAWASPVILLFLLVLLAASSLRILREYQRGVVFQLGRFWRVKGPGLVILVPGIQQMVKVDLRTVVFEVPTQDVISRGQRVGQGERRRLSPRDRCRKGDHPGREITSMRRANWRRRRCVRSWASTSSTTCWRVARSSISTSSRPRRANQLVGVKVSNVEMKQVDLTESMIRAIARQAEAERERRAKVIHAEGGAAGFGKAVPGRQGAGAGTAGDPVALSGNADGYRCGQETRRS
jgi:regulator of protease activity HflC (stomatin/prohibitin superfamily)